MAFEIKERLHRGAGARPTSLTTPGHHLQVDVYWYAFGVGVELGADGIVDIGCGWADKLEQIPPHRPDWRYTGIDHGRTSHWCREQPLPGGSGSGSDLEEPPGSTGGRVVVCADVIEHLRDPLAMLHSIRGRAAWPRCSRPLSAICSGARTTTARRRTSATSASGIAPSSAPARGRRVRVDAPRLHALRRPGAGNTILSQGGQHELLGDLDGQGRG